MQGRAGGDAAAARGGLLDTRVMTVSGETLDASLDWWERERAAADVAAKVEGAGWDRCRRRDHVAGSGAGARAYGTVCFPVGNLAPEGSVIKSTAIDPSLMDEDNVYRHVGPARVFMTETAAIDAIKTARLGMAT